MDPPTCPARGIFAPQGVQRVVLAGGDISSHAARGVTLTQSATVLLDPLAVPVLDEAREVTRHECQLE